MSNKDLVKTGQKYLVASSNESLRKDVGSGLIMAGGGGLAIVGLAALIPFVSALMLLLVVLGAGVYTYFK